MGEILDPSTAELGRLALVEDEPQGDRRMQPDRRAAFRVSVRVLPGECEALVATQLRRNDDLEVRECTICLLYTSDAADE